MRVEGQGGEVEAAGAVDLRSGRRRARGGRRGRRWRGAGSPRASTRAAASAARPETTVWREAEVLPASGVRWVSPPTKRKAASGRPRASAAIWAITVDEPWPMSMAPWCRTTAPSRARPMRIVEGFGSAVLPQPYQAAARPTPRRTTGRWALCAAAAARAARQRGARASRQSTRPMLASRWPVAVASPSRRAFLRRKSSGSRPAASARRSIRVSVAIAACGTPKPRKAPETGPWVWTARAVAATAGTR